MPRAHEAVAVRQGGNAPARLSRRRGEPARRRHVHQQIPVADLVEMDLVHRHVVDRGFGLREVAQDGGRVRGRAGTERRGGERAACRESPRGRGAGDRDRDRGDDGGWSPAGADSPKRRQCRPALVPVVKAGVPVPGGSTAAASASTRARRSGRASTMAAANMSPAMPPTASRRMARVIRRRRPARRRDPRK